MVAVTFLNFNSNDITILLTGTTITVPPVLFGILTVVLVWVSINVTNCSDGVDGLSGTLTIITLMIIYLVDLLQSRGDSFSYLILLFCVCIPVSYTHLSSCISTVRADPCRPALPYMTPCSLSNVMCARCASVWRQASVPSFLPEGRRESGWRCPMLKS